MKAVEIKDLCFKYDVEDVLKNISFSVEQGSYTTIIGHNGSGKSTIAKLMLGLLEKGSGSIKIEGEELTEENLYAMREKIGIVFQNPDNQFIGSTVRDDIAFGLENHCVKREEMDPLIETFSTKVGMQDYLNSEPTKLSGGQKQRVAIAGVLAMAPNILVFDEATSMLDPQGKKEINELIREIHKERQLTIVSITHDMDEVAQSDSVIVLDHGKIAMMGDPKEVLQREEEMVRMSLDVPFPYKLRKALRKQGIETSPELTMEGMVEELCRLHSNK